MRGTSGSGITTRDPDYSLHGGMAVIVAAIVVELSSIFFRSPIAVETVGCTV